MSIWQTVCILGPCIRCPLTGFEPYLWTEQSQCRTCPRSVAYDRAPKTPESALIQLLDCTNGAVSSAHCDKRVSESAHLDELKAIAWKES